MVAVFVVIPFGTTTMNLLSEAVSTIPFDALIFCNLASGLLTEHLHKGICAVMYPTAFGTARSTYPPLYETK